MMGTSDGSQVNAQKDPKEFLTEYAGVVEDAIRRMQNIRIPAPGDTALAGVERVAPQV